MQCGVSVTWHVTSRLYRLLVGGLGTGLVACLYHAPAATSSSRIESEHLIEWPALEKLSIITKIICQLSIGLVRSLCERFAQIITRQGFAQFARDRARTLTGVFAMT